ncbi:glycosyltransferase, partial [Streptomyces sp. AF1A]|uniref:glycosyltransferase n=1 Tax=Streptomyces sp. AF1A TaxID=3394350 RepID=UPI0039BD89CC
RELRVRLGRAGRERVLRNFTWARAAQGTVARYREAIARDGRGGDHGRDGRSTAPIPGRSAAPQSVVPAASASVASAAATSDTGVYTESRATC